MPISLRARCANPIRRLLHEIAADIDRRKPDLMPVRLKPRSKLGLLEPRAGPESYKLDFSWPQLSNNMLVGVTINAREFRIGVNRRMLQRNLTPEIGLPRRHVEQFRIEPVGP